MIKIKTALSDLIRTVTLSVTILLCILSTACQPEDKPVVPDVSELDIDLQFRRFEQDLFQLDTGTAFREELQQLESGYGEFARVYFQYILGSKESEESTQRHQDFVRGFITYPPVRQLYDTTRQIFGQMEDIRSEFEQALRFYKYYFPEKKTPSITTYLSEFGLQSFIYGDDDLAVGLDFFLGSSFPYRNIDPVNSNFSGYLTRTYNRDHLVAKTLHPLVQEVFNQSHGGRMLDVMIQKGKQLYLLDRLLPFEPDTVIMEVSQDQWKWLENNELEIWSYFLNETDKTSGQSLLYSTDWATYRKFVDYSPSSPGMPPEAPGRTASYMGWKIVAAWMERKASGQDIQALLKHTDAQKLLEESRYKPSRLR